jgi:hypothetical protein
MKIGNIPNMNKDYDDLEKQEKEKVAQALSSHARSDPSARHYVHWHTLISQVGLPSQNLVETALSHNGLCLPIKIVSGMEKFLENRLFVMDSEIMDKWDKMQL